MEERLYSFVHPEAEPEVEHLLASNIKPDGFMLQWTAPEGIFEMFIIKLSDGSGKQRQMIVSGDKRTEVISDLDEATEYEIEISGAIPGRNFKPISGKARTGIWMFWTSKLVKSVFHRHLFTMSSE